MDIEVIAFILQRHTVGKKGGSNFDVAMGAYNGGEVCKLIGIFYVVTI